MLDSLRSDRSRKKSLRLRDPISNACQYYTSVNSKSSSSSAKSDKKNNQNENSKHNKKISEKKIHDLHRSASLDSLNNSSDQESFLEDEQDGIYSESDPEIAHITGTTSVQVHRRSDLEELKDLQTPKNDTIREYLEKQHKNNCNGNCDENISSCDCLTTHSHKKKLNYNVCVTSSTKSNNKNLTYLNNSNNIESISDCSSNSINNTNYENSIVPKSISNGSISSNSSTGSSIRNRRTSVASSGSVGRMETILEEPIEPKISVKEILARFETLNSIEIQSKTSTISSGARAAAQTLNVPLERLEASRGEPIHQHQHQHVTTASIAELKSNVAAIEKNHQHLGNYQSNHTHSNGVGQHHDRQQSGSSSAMIHHHVNGSAQSGGVGHIPSSHHDQIEQHLLVKQTSNLHPRKSSNSNHHHHQDPSGFGHQANDEDSVLGTSPSVTKYSLLQFAMQHFQNEQTSDEHHMNLGRGDKRSSSSRPAHADLVKWQGTPIRSPLLRLPVDLAPLALECFDCILRYCGDIPPDPELTEVKCVYTVLMHCHKYLALRDEVYCQLMKQTTANRSPCPDSSQRAWRLLSILAAYFGCSDALRPYLMEHLTTAASDRRRSCHGTAAVCLTNLRKTARCGGRKNVPSVEEVTAVSAGRSARRQIYRLPGGAERVVNTRCSTVVADVIAELCSLLGIESEAEQQEFSLYCIVQGDAFTMPLSADEYILDVTTELLKSGQPFYLIFCRSVWHFPLKRDPAPTPLYIEVLFNQVAPDYLEGLLLELPNNGVPIPEVVHDMARIAALLHRAADLNHVPAMKEIKFLLPKPALGIRELRPAQWVGLVQSAWPTVANLTPGQVKAQFLSVLSSWPLFGSSFFAVKRVFSEEGPHVEEGNPMWRELILALNRRGVLFLDPNSHETLQHWPFMEVISTRKVRSEDGALFLDMKVGNLMQQRVIRVQTEQAHEISRLVRQYITMAQVNQRDRRD